VSGISISFFSVCVVSISDNGLASAAKGKREWVEYSILGTQMGRVKSFTLLKPWVLNLSNMPSLFVDQVNYQDLLS
jgi:hypothetical protein